MTYLLADSTTTIGWLQIVVPTGVSLLVALIGGWAVVAKYQQKIDDAKEDIKELKKEVGDLKVKHTEVATKLEERTGSAEAKVLKRKSPVSLNDYGEKILKESTGDSFVINNLDNLVEKIKRKNPGSAYDVQVYAKDVISEVSSEDRFVPIKDYAFKEGLDLEVLVVVMGVYLRDLALSRLGFKPEDLDATDPTKKK